MPYDFSGMTALSDPTRRRVFELVWENPRSVAALASQLPISQPAVSQHLKALKNARLVRVEQKGASNVYHIDPQGLGEMRAWIDRMWNDSLEAFRNETEINQELPAQREESR